MTVDLFKLNDQGLVTNSAIVSFSGADSH